MAKRLAARKRTASRHLRFACDKPPCYRPDGEKEEGNGRSRGPNHPPPVSAWAHAPPPDPDDPLGPALGTIVATVVWLCG